VFGCESPSRSLTLVPGKRKLYPTKLPSWLKPTKHRQEHVWDAEGSRFALDWIRSLFDESRRPAAAVTGTTDDREGEK